MAATVGVLLSSGCTTRAPVATSAAGHQSAVEVSAGPSASALNAGAAAPTAPTANPDLGPMTLSSPAFPAGGIIPVNFSCAGDNLSPPLSWRGAAPSGTKSWAVIMEDLDVRPGPWVQWVVTAIPASTRALDAGRLPTTAVAHRNSNGTSGFVGACPPQGAVHRFQFTVYAIKQDLTLPPSADAATSVHQITQAASASAVLIGQFDR